jgi:hypothetical protein
MIMTDSLENWIESLPDARIKQSPPKAMQDITRLFGCVAAKWERIKTLTAALPMIDGPAVSSFEASQPIWADRSNHNLLGSEQMAVPLYHKA